MAQIHSGALSFLMLRHAGDHDDGIENSWFPEITVRGKGIDGGTIHLGFTHKKTSEHGWPKDFACTMASNVLLAGEIDLTHWNYVCNH